MKHVVPMLPSETRFGPIDRADRTVLAGGDGLYARTGERDAGGTGTPSRSACPRPTVPVVIARH
jgi:hypothetical protein